MKGLLRYIYRNLLTARLQRSIDNYCYFSGIHRSIAIFKHLTMAKIDGLNEKKILILSPHPDDDIIGCGGTLQKYRQKGAEITCLYMTDGRKGNPAYNEDGLAIKRKEEARRAAEVIGINRLIFLDNRDGELTASSLNITELIRILHEIKPDAVFLPFLLDTHRDHMATNRIFLGAIKSMPPFMCYAFGIWTPLPAFNLSVDITPYVDIKRKAMEEHRSQTEWFDLTGASFGLSKYYSIMSNGRDGKGWAEVYIVCPSDEYARLGKAIGW
ncbi:MAG TPA: PIG-L deacetylase family protein [Nitrospirota bacterium]|nr:PIG-L deacetylase family protein [Nitrospirota bacterium]